MTIAAILKTKGNDVLQVAPDATVLSVVAMLAEKRIGCVPVVDGGEVVGIFSERDVVYQLGQGGPAMLDAVVSGAMTSPAVTITSDTPVMSALSLMTRRRMRHLPVVDGGKLVGFVSIGDLVKYRIDRIESEAAAMRDYIQSA
ncbi:CBS domain-containing protein [soil metagenome]|jgi:CBS domain-containing protein|uniref:CBS domain-containing protein n=1 Tax=unclassified Sphingobium TaxID=2611147 RepID=UPI001E28D4ED|nr:MULTISPECIES: CBS domain-containing protein [unclassified Sphingobium]GLI99745.1 inosine-5-monophosphate dehydrogenase [Sphingobium sp. BS19]CAH0356729.1 Inosine-5'-monophosphate dehydrogenase [Sphingobium sp. CECT 9361]|tara:strand:+ start:99 stop:527 length:429 start_codon:yes stop_codon:yes gene_type:complete